MGKTQTILNLIANLLIRGKPVAVAAPANAAADNVAEKLQAAGYCSLVARLESRERREAFFASPPAFSLGGRRVALFWRLPLRSSLVGRARRSA